MLTATSLSNTNKQSNATNSVTSIQPVSNVASPSNSIKNIKNEPFTSLSPKIVENVNNTNVMDDRPNNNNSSNKNLTMDTQISQTARERDNSSSSNVILRQNSNNIGSCSTSMAIVSSPNHGSEHSSNSNLSQSNMDKVNSDITQEISNDKSIKKKCNSVSNLSVKEEDGLEKINTNTMTKRVTSVTPTINSTASIKEEPDRINNLVTIKKEDTAISPEMSPVGFGTIPPVIGASSSDKFARAGTPVKQNEILPNMNNNNSNEKASSGLGNNSSCNEDLNIGSRTSNDICNNNIGQQILTTSVTGNANTGILLGNSMEYMQQQNHIFVFSTKLANKGAECVLSGQFPTIIAYHCTQPATKNFLEDFFIKNPMKMTKLQRQNSLNISGLPVGNCGQAWLSNSNSNSLSKIPQKVNNTKINFGVMDAAASDNKLHAKTNLRQSNIVGFQETSDALSGENDIMCWEQSRNNLEESGTTDNLHSHIKLLDGVGTESAVEVALNRQSVPNKSINSSDMISADNNIPSLQGVKVPDENLTPQQRQHREEQLAKLKKMNQFLFPENGNEFRAESSNMLQGNNQLEKLSDNVGNNLTGLMLNMPPASGLGTQMGCTINPTCMRNISSNLINPKQGENLTTGLEDEAVIGNDIMSAHDIAGIQCNNKNSGNKNSISNQSNTSCSSELTMNSITNIGNMNNNNAVSCLGANPSTTGPTGSGGLISSSPEIVGFNQNCIVNDTNTVLQHKSMSTNLHNQDVGQLCMSSQMEWSKMQNQFFDDRMKNNKTSNGISNSLCRSTSTGAGNLRTNLSTSNTSSTCQSSQSQAIRSNQGPPPPYHSTQRCSSVPIAIQSPNPTSPNNPTSNLSLPSPRTAGGMPANSPNMDVHTITSTPSTSSMTATASTGNSTKTSFTTQENSSPTSNNSNTNRSRNNLNQFNSNPSTPISNMSPKDIETFTSNSSTGDLKNLRPSPQRSRTPLISSNNSNVSEQSGIESRFPSVSPGSNFPQHLQNSGNNRQTSIPVQGQLCRRSDNVPLNPNISRSNPNKMSLPFDPISSLAQMSQQLTSCVPLNSGVGNSVCNMGENNISSNVNQNMEALISTIDGNVDHCSPISTNNALIPPHLNTGGPFGTSNCHINPMINSMGQRLLSPKICGSGFPANTSGMREAHNSFPGMMPGHPRMIGRLPFGNFNVSSNIQVKASTPNTIQYMPVKPQNNGNNMRIPPSLEFLQRYANPQMSNASNIIDNSNITPITSGVIPDQTKLVNSNVQPGHNINFFQNCNQMSVGGSIGGEDEIASNLLQAHDMNMPPLIARGMRPIRHSNMNNPVITAPRMQAATMPQFSGSSQDSIDCSDLNNVFCPPTNSPATANQIFPGSGQQKQINKGMSGICQNINSGNSTGNNMQVHNTALTQNDTAVMQSAMNAPSAMLGANPNNNIMQNTLVLSNNVGSAGPCAVGSNTNSNVNYKSFVGPNTNDLKYAQQYHSFQQQLYATSTRSQHVGSANIATNISANAAFFNNK
ncbi:protein BCL9 homolog isoform X2 [Teleopsis dalmanni]|uniref:protein BCL9 homolog isoform X2 n=1 Tax=Teleopsis dalmanni TaxID=139649 RepID=UPI0018CD3271|nr:protein BCL9 homolog isoform X2 [Teleopsis dalmanni]